MQSYTEMRGLAASLETALAAARSAAVKPTLTAALKTASATFVPVEGEVVVAIAVAASVAAEANSGAKSRSAKDPCARNPIATVVVTGGPDVAVAGAGRDVVLYGRSANVASADEPPAAVATVPASGKAFAAPVKAVFWATFRSPNCAAFRAARKTPFRISVKTFLRSVGCHCASS